MYLTDRQEAGFFLQKTQRNKNKLLNFKQINKYMKVVNMWSHTNVFK